MGRQCLAEQQAFRGRCRKNREQHQGGNLETLQQKVQHMKLVVDSNRIFAALIRDSVSRKILLSPKFSFLGVYFSQAEIKKHEKEILSKAGITRRDYLALFDMFFRKIRLFDETEISAV